MKSDSEVTPAGPIKVAIVSALAVIIPMIITGIICNLIFPKPHQETSMVNEKETENSCNCDPLEKVDNSKTKLDY